MKLTLVVFEANLMHNRTTLDALLTPKQLRDRKISYLHSPTIVATLHLVPRFHYRLLLCYSGITSGLLDPEFWSRSATDKLSRFLQMSLQSMGVLLGRCSECKCISMQTEL
jgi:hypothetical protein